jgi:hypothetical protein
LGGDRLQIAIYIRRGDFTSQSKFWRPFLPRVPGRAIHPAAIIGCREAPSVSLIQKPIPARQHMARSFSFVAGLYHRGLVLRFPGHPPHLPGGVKIGRGGQFDRVKARRRSASRPVVRPVA